MIADCAIDPEVFAMWRHFQSLSEDFGVSQGRLISEFPRNWRKKVIENARKLASEDIPVRATTDLQATRIVNKLKNERFKRKLKNSGRTFDSSCTDWLAAAVYADPPFDLLITSGADTSENCIGIDELLKDEAPFFRKSQGHLTRNSKSLMGVAELLVSTCNEFIVVDPNFRADELRFSAPLLHLISLLEKKPEWTPKRFEVHTSRLRNPKDEFHRGPQKSQWREHIVPHLPNLWNLDVCYWDTMANGGKPHARFLLTEIGGICYEYGLDEGPGETLVTLLEDEVWESLFKTFDAQVLPVNFDSEQYLIGFYKNRHNDT